MLPLSQREATMATKTRKRLAETHQISRAALYLRVSRGSQTTENQRMALEAMAKQRGWVIVETYEDAGISGAKGRDQRASLAAVLLLSELFGPVALVSLDLAR